ncbi:N-terminal acetyltransferase B complex catalytic subunit NAA20-like [Lycium barbarum]|uniref:N-terminal acetyltransferase B complex catalytic subunit NAA20-like n=1 Tax=Lycium barbarum TaxID=112863 RepID=UPI00293EDE04|nr:N-terminal acetyltransferase B complex catalytic subunit NAA20-like [Lycium barbarum]
MLFLEPRVFRKQSPYLRWGSQDWKARLNIPPPNTRYKTELGYIIYRRVVRYYSGKEDGMDVRKALPRGVQKKSYHSP